MPPEPDPPNPDAPESLELLLVLPLPVVDELTGTSVSTVIEVGVMRISTGRPFLSLALTTKELGTTLTSLKPADVSL
jgi:hypothetical protein